MGAINRANGFGENHFLNVIFSPLALVLLQWTMWTFEQCDRCELWFFFIFFYESSKGSTIHIYFHSHLWSIYQGCQYFGNTLFR